MRRYEMNVSSEQRARRACEQCRRKKVRCTAERPICSFCRRLDQQCIYLPREQTPSRGGGTDGVVKSTSSKERVKALESHIGQIYGILQGLSDRDGRGLSPLSQLGWQAAIPQNISNGFGRTIESQVVPVRPTFDKTTGHDVPSEVLQYFIAEHDKVFAQKPLPLFSTASMQVELAAGPCHLRWSFTSLMLRFSCHPWFGGKEIEAADFYSNSAYDALMPIITVGAGDLEAIQSLCLLALHDLKALRHARAWNSVGTAARLEVSRNWSRRDLARRTREDDGDNSSRCFWSVFILEKAFSPQCTLLDQCPKPPRCPKSMRPPLRSQDGEDSPICDEALVAEDFDSLEDGVYSPCLEAVSIWGKVVSYLHQVRCKRLENAWLPGSKYSQLTQEIYGFERQTALKHLFGNVAPQGRSPSEVLAQAEYWRPWFLMQITHHATSAVLNHPFLHTVALRGTEEHAAPRLFLQSVIDSAIYHSRWVVRLLQICEELQFDISDPLVGNLVAATATIPWLFQFAQDEQASITARNCYLRCEKFLMSAAARWPHIEQQASSPMHALTCRALDTLRGLQPFPATRQQEDSDDSSTITFRSSMLWRLLDYNSLQVTMGEANDRGGSRASPMPEATLRVSTHILHPVDEVAGHSKSPGTANGSVPTPIDSDLEQIFLDDLLSGYASSEMLWLQPNSTQGPLVP